MLFGDPSEFAIEIYHEPSSQAFRGFGRMCVHSDGKTIGDIFENHCSLFHAVERIDQFASNIDSLWDDQFVGKTDIEIFDLLDHSLYLGIDSLWSRFGRFDFLTNTGEQFDHTKTFIFSSLNSSKVYLLFKIGDLSPTSSSFTRGAFLETASELKSWFQDQIDENVTQLFPVDPHATE